MYSDIPEAFAKRVSDYTKSHFNLDANADSVDLTYSSALYNAILLYAHAATAVLSRGEDLRNGTAVTAEIRHTSFMGAGNSIVMLDSHGDRISSYEVMNYILRADDKVSRVVIGIFNSTDWEYNTSGRAVVWPGNTDLLPLDYVSGALRADWSLL